MKSQPFSATVSEVRLKVRNKDIIRKRYPKNVDQTAIDNKHLASIPYNVCNNLITHEDVAKIFNIVNMSVVVHDLNLYQRAFIHASYLLSTLSEEEDVDAQTELKEAIPKLISERYIDDSQKGSLLPLQKVSSERLEYLGDAVCGVCVADYLYHRFPDEDEGFMTRLRTRLVCGTKLGEFAEKLGLQNHVIISRYVEIVNNGRKNYKVLEDVFEAFVGALYVDNNRDKQICYDFMIAVIEKFIDFTDIITNENNFKDVLLRYMQKHFDGAFPVYRELSVDVQNGVKIYNMAVLDPTGSQIIGCGSGRKKRSAEQESSRKALIYYEQISPDAV